MIFIEMVQMIQTADFRLAINIDAMKNLGIANLLMLKQICLITVVIYI